MSSSAPSYEDTLRHHKITSVDLEVKCPEEFLRHVATWTNYEEWRKTDLGVDKATVEAIKNQNTDDEGKCRDLVERWRQRLGHNATYSRLVLCFIDSRRADLADKVCEEFVKRKAKKCETARVGKRDKLSPRDVQNFPSPAPETAMSVGRDIHHDVETISSDQQAPPQSPTTPRDPVSCTSTGEQEQNRGEQPSDMVINQAQLTTGAHPTATDASSALDTLNRVARMLERRDSTVDKKKGKIKELKERQTELQGYLTENNKKIEQQKNEAEQTKSKLQETLENANQKINQLEDDVFQKDRELQQEKDDKNETCEQLREQLEQARTELEEAKSESERNLVEAQIQCLQDVVDRANSEACLERSKINDVLEWTEKDLVKEQDELQTILERQKKYTKCTILVFISITVVLIALLVQVVPQYCLNY